MHDHNITTQRFKAEKQLFCTSTNALSIIISYVILLLTILSPFPPCNSYAPYLDYTCPGPALAQCSCSDASQAVIAGALFSGPWVGGEYLATCVPYTGSAANSTLAKWICGVDDGATKMVMIDLTLSGWTLYGCMSDARYASPIDQVNETTLNAAWDSPSGSAVGGYYVRALDIQSP